MKFLVVSSPHGYTTRDVWKRVLTGLGANGVDAYAFDLLPRWNAFSAMINLAVKNKVEIPDAFYANLLAYEPIFGAAHFHDVDTVMFVSPQYAPMTLIDMLRKAGKKTIGYFTECPYEDTGLAPMQAAHFDYTFVNDKHSVGLYRSFCDNVFYMPHSFDQNMHYPAVTPAANNRVLFIGTGYNRRVDFFDAINWKGIDLELYGIWWLDKRKYGWLQRRHRLARYKRGDVLENQDVAEMYRTSAVNISIHRSQRNADGIREIDDGEAYSAGPRTWELAACEAFQVSDYRQEIEDVFGDAVPFYDTPAELEALLRRAIGDPVWRQEQAVKQREAVQGHDCTRTMRGLLEAVA